MDDVADDHDCAVLEQLRLVHPGDPDVPRLKGELESGKARVIDVEGHLDGDSAPHGLLSVVVHHADQVAAGVRNGHQRIDQLSGDVLQLQIHRYSHSLTIENVIPLSSTARYKSIGDYDGGFRRNRSKAVDSQL